MAATDALRRFGGMYGSAYRDNELLADVVEVNGNIEVNRIEVPLVGQTKQGYKSGRESRQGNIRIQKIDAAWEKELYDFIANRQQVGSGYRTRTALRPFDLVIRVDDPEAWDYEEWSLTGCQIWRIPVGFSITDDIIDREFPLTWESENLITGNNLPKTFAERAARLKADSTPTGTV